MMIDAGQPDPYGRLTDIALRHKQLRPDAPAFIWLRGGEEVSTCLSFAALYDQAAAIAAALAARGRPGERALLLYPATGLDFIPAFLGCLLAGVVPVPAYKPSAHRDKAERLEAIVANAQATLVMSTAQGFEDSARGLAASPVLSKLDHVVAEIGAAPHAVGRPVSHPSPVAFLQYTSGSTAAPKGVIVTHDNLAHNARIIAESCECDAASVFLTWLPLFHDLGLIGNVLQSFRFGVPCYVMSPAAFLQRPGRWLEAMSRFRVTNATAPNFAYELCAQKYEAQDSAALDLSAIRVLLNGAEKVRAETLHAFNRVFTRHGLCPRALRPAYGLAEATLIVSAAAPGEGLDHVASVDAQALEMGALQAPSASSAVATLAVAGRVRGGQSVAIVDPQTRRRCAPHEIGEIWLRGPSVAAGYWGNEAATNEAFAASIDGEEAGWLRTGDLGALHQGQLIVTGRCKELIILHGRNHYPQDIERIVQAVSADLRQDSGAAFGIDTPNGEALVIVQEVERTALRHVDPASLAISVRQALMAYSEISLHALVLVPPGGVPKTSSGKIQRGVARARYLAGELPSLQSPQAAAKIAAARDSTPDAQPEAGAHATTLIAWLRDYAQTRINSRLMDERRSIPPSIVLDFGNVGLLGLQAPRAFGGLGMPDAGFLRVIEQLGAIDQTLALFVTLNNVLGIRPIAGHATRSIQERHLPLLATGRELGAFALTEPGAGSNPLALQSTARPHPDGGFLLSGQKIWSGSASWAGVMNVFARQLSPHGEVLGISGFVVEQGRAGVRQGPEALTMGMRGMVQNAIQFDDARVEAACLLGRERDGMAVAQDAMLAGRVAIGAMCLGGIRRCLQIMLRYGGRRMVGTGLLAANPAFRAEAGRLAIMAQGIEAALALAARPSEAGAVPLDLAAAIKVTAPEMFWRAADMLVQFLGGRGYIESNLAPLLLRDARVLRIFEGPTETMRAHVGARLAHGTSDIPGLLAGIAPAAKQVLDTAMDRLAALPALYRRQGEDEVSAQRALTAALGEVASQAVLLGALNARNNSARAQAWFTASIEQTTRLALDQAMLTASLLPSGEIPVLMDALTASIGDVEQHAAGEDVALDALLCRAPGTSAQAPQASVAARPDPPPAAPDAAGAIRLEIERQVRRALSLDPDRRLDEATSFAELGLDSVSVVSLAFELEDALGTQIDPTSFWEFITIGQLAAEIGRRRARKGTAAAAPAGGRADPSPRGQPQHGAARQEAISPGDIDALSEAEAEMLLRQAVGAAT